MQERVQKDTSSHCQSNTELPESSLVLTLRLIIRKKTTTTTTKCHNNATNPTAVEYFGHMRGLGSRNFSADLKITKHEDD